VALILEPFPTIYWLANPSLSRAVSILEDKHGGIKALEARLPPGSAALKSMAEAHAKCAKRRVALLEPADLAELRASFPSFLEKLAGTGVAGIDFGKSPGKVKCLHAHVAHYLGGWGGGGGEDNVVGRWAVEWCRELGLINF
jgi:hypothetical protein